MSIVDQRVLRWVKEKKVGRKAAIERVGEYSRSESVAIGRRKESG